MNLDPKALIAAYDAFAATGISADHEGISAAIIAYLASAAGIEKLDLKGLGAAASVLEARKYDPWTVDSAAEIANAVVTAYLAQAGVSRP